MVTAAGVASPAAPPDEPVPAEGPAPGQTTNLPWDAIPEALRREACCRVRAGRPLYWLTYRPAEECFFNGDDPFFQARHTPDVLWGGIVARAPWPQLAEMDAYRCVLDFHLLTTATRPELDEYYRYMAEEIRIDPVSLLALMPPGEGSWRAGRRGPRSGPGDANAAGGASDNEARSAVPKSGTELSSAESATLDGIVAIQRQILSLPTEAAWQLGRIKASSAALAGCLARCRAQRGDPGAGNRNHDGARRRSAGRLRDWLDGEFNAAPGVATTSPISVPVDLGATACNPRHGRPEDQQGGRRRSQVWSPRGRCHCRSEEPQGGSGQDRSPDESDRRERRRQERAALSRRTRRIGIRRARTRARDQGPVRGDQPHRRGNAGRDHAGAHVAGFLRLPALPARVRDLSRSLARML